ncbi:MAG: TIM barrel protein [Syntrophobacteraceae bacterium]|nr:TIM barrel protein [Syntrophobacteraceae bacterium]
MNLPTIAICNFIPDTADLREMAIRNGFSGVDWTFKVEDLPRSQAEESRLLEKISMLNGLEIRYHCAFNGVDAGDEDDRKADEAMEIFQKVCRVVSRLEGTYMTIHLGLGRKSPEGLSWERTVSSLAELVAYAKSLGIELCLENLASGWSSRPHLFEKLVRKSGAGITLDIGHARVCQAVRCRSFELEDFVTPNPGRVFNAHIYHEEIDDRHVPPECVENIRNRLDLLCALSCNWWVLELREEAPLMQTLKIVREYMENPENESKFV